MEEIILSEEQNKAINYNRVGAYAIKGIAGSGKTTVGLHRISYLAKKCLEGERILIVTFHKVLVNYLENLIEKDKTQNIELNFNSSKICDFKSIDSLVFRMYCKFRDQNFNHKYYKKLPKNISKTQDLELVFRTALTATSKTFPNIESYDDSEFLKDEIDYINNCGINTLKEYQVFSRSGLGRFTESRSRIPKKSNIREAIFQLRRTYNNLLISKGLIDFPVMRLLAQKQVTDNPPKKYTHIIIDECQDMDHTQLNILKHFLEHKPNASATFLYDNTQSIYKSSWLGNGHSFKSLGIDIKGRSKILKHNFRTTYEIQEAAQSLILGNKYISQEIEPVLINKCGTKPFWAHCNDFEHQVNYIFDVIKTHSENFNLNDIIVTARSWSHVTKLNQALLKKDINCGILQARDNSIKKNQVRIMTVHSSKGLECEVMILADLNEGIFPWKAKNTSDIVRDLKLLYVGMTRASRHLYLTSYNKQSVFFDSINHNTLKIVDFEKFESYQPIEDPKVREKLAKLIDSLMDVINSSSKMKLSLKSKNDFKTKVNQLIQVKHQLEIIREELIDIKNEVPANTSTHSLYDSLWIQVGQTISKADNELFNTITVPIDFKECSREIKESYSNFSDKSINSITTVEWELKRADILEEKSGKDWASSYTLYSKALETELKNVLRRNDLKLVEMLDSIKDREEPFNSIYDMLERKRFRKNRNDATHNKNINIEEILDVREVLMDNYGVFHEINNLLSE
jgi:superfamily I DNA/RNA helicase